MSAKIFILFSVFAAVSPAPLSCSFDYNALLNEYKNQGRHDRTCNVEIPLDKGLNDYETMQLANSPVMPNTATRMLCNPKETERSFKGTGCPWRYECDYNPQRFPQIMYYAKCEQNYWIVQDAKNQLVAKYQCEEVMHAVPTLRTDSCDPLGDTAKWTWQMESVPVSCVAKI